MPVRQTIPVPHDVPFGLSAFSVQTAVPVVHTFVPVRQRLVGVQVEPAMQVTQVPLLQTLFVPQLVPFATAVPVSVHDIVPLAEQAT
jgi:hypothetical protein